MQISLAVVNILPFVDEILWYFCMAVNIFVQTKIDASKHSVILTDQIDALLDFVWYEKDTTWKILSDS